MPLQEWLFPLAVVFAGYLVLGITGFGSALVLVPLLAWQWPLPEVVALALLLDIPASMLHGGLNLAQVRWRELLRLLPGMAAGTLLGLWLLDQVAQRWLLLVLGAYVVWVGVRALRPSAATQPAPARWALVAGTLVGLVEVMFATAGPVVVAWLQRRLDEVAGLRATVPVVMVLAGSVALAMLFGSAHIDMPSLLPRWLVALPLAGAAVWLGNRVAARIPALLMKRLMAGLLTLSGLSLMRHFWL